MLPPLSATLITLVSLAAIVAATPASFGRLHGIQRRTTGRTCGSELSPEAVIENENLFNSLLAQGSSRPAAPQAAVVPVYFNVIYDGSVTDEESGDIPDSQIEDQITALNNDFAETGLKFELQKTDRIDNKDWFDNVNQGNSQEADMKGSLRQGDAGTLNVYTVGFNNDGNRGLLGYATFPADYESKPTNDGVVLLYSTLPGGSKKPYDEGRTLTHEVGHWVGLYHTFQGGCKGKGDYVDDTPAEAEPSEGCPIGRDTCPSEGKDPVENYMDYSDDSCMNNFTPGQIDRLQQQIDKFRGIYV